MPGLAIVTLADAMLNGLRGIPFSLGNLYVQIHTADPGRNGTNAISVGSTARPQVNLINSAGAIAVTGIQATWTNTGAAAETLTHVSVWSSPTPGGGTFYWSAILTDAYPWSANQTTQLYIMGVNLTPVAT